MAGDQLGQFFVGDLAGAPGLDHDRGRARHADGVGNLDQAARGQAGGDDVLGDVAGGVGGGAVHLGRVLAGKRAAAVRGGTTVGIDDDLAAGEAGVAVRAADLEHAGRVDQELDVALDQLFRQHRLDDVLDDGVDGGLLHALDGDAVLADLLGHLGTVLGGQHHGVDGDRLAIDVLEGDLRLGVRPQPGQATILAQHGLALDQAMRQIDRHRHQRRRFVAGVAEHQALVAGALVEIVVGGAIDALGDVGALLAVADVHRAAVGVETQGRIGIADAADGVARDLGVIDLGVGGDLAGEDDETGGDQRFRRDAGELVLGQDGVEDGVGDLVGDLVRMSFGHRFRGEQILMAHDDGCRVPKP